MSSSQTVSSSQTASYQNHLLAHLIAHNFDLSSREEDPHRPLWHLYPPMGFMNDPNGFCQKDGVFHLFYQWNPYHLSHHSFKLWGHASSPDLVRWRHHAPALYPDFEGDREGCYSGSAIATERGICLFYTGNRKASTQGELPPLLDNRWELDRDKNPPVYRSAYQCAALLSDTSDGSFLEASASEKTCLFGLEEGYTGHIRDPKVFCHEDTLYMVLGARTLDDKGHCLLYQKSGANKNEEKWVFLSAIAGTGLTAPDTETDFAGYMWECPDLFSLDGKDILIFSPMGARFDGLPFLGAGQAAAYTIGEMNFAAINPDKTTANKTAPHFRHGAIKPLDEGPDFYAPQTTLSEDGRRLLFGWMGGFYTPANTLPSALESGWVYQQTCPRELTLHEGILYQTPAREIETLRGEASRFEGRAVDGPKLKGRSIELCLYDIKGDIELFLGEHFRLVVNGEGVFMSRETITTESTATLRHYRGAVREIRCLLDTSSIEIFINKGQAVFSWLDYHGMGREIALLGGGALTLVAYPLFVPFFEEA